ncbi:MAG TPA: LptF/LptG family permease [Phycisphaerae bacterium]|nr:LptF/LptG family permease [Phycisphaerae bacterium]
MRTLRTYLARDLIKYTLLTTAALTVLLSVLAFLEPLREQGLSGARAIKYLGYVLPLMFSFALPFGALFAATIVYGRFSEDNELMASRASGVCTLNVLSPAMWLGAVVTVVTLLLVLYVAPRMLGKAQSVVKDDLEQLAFYRLRKRQHIDWGRRLFHADQTNPERQWVRGAVGVELDPKKGPPRVMVASSAKLDFRDAEGRPVVHIHATKPRMFVQGSGSTAREEAQPWMVTNLPMGVDQPKTYDWSRLWRTRSRPQSSPKVVADLEGVRRRICVDRFHADLTRRLASPGGYYDLIQPPAAPGAPAATRVRIEAPVVTTGKNRQVLLRSTAGGAGPPPELIPRRVKVREYLGDKPVRALEAAEAEVEAQWETYQDAPVVRLTLLNVVSVSAGGPEDDPGALSRDDMGPFAVPPTLVAEARGISLTELYEHPERFKMPGVVNRVKQLKDGTVLGLVAKVEAEIHQRLAYGLSCVFTVMIGAALGLLFRGGQLLAAAALAAIPTAVVWMASLMGRQLIANTDVPASHGIAVIWAGFGLLALAAAWLYLVPLRR